MLHISRLHQQLRPAEFRPLLASLEIMATRQLSVGSLAGVWQSSYDLACWHGSCDRVVLTKTGLAWFYVASGVMFPLVGSAAS